jgi:xanthine dehydrogenase accessory factor
MNPDFFDRVSQLKRDGKTFVIATVVSRRAPVSSHLGDRAIVFADGRMDGFVGGSCSREIVRRQALEAMRLGKPRLVLIRPDATLEQLQHAADAESIVVPMTCASEGAVDVYLEPHARARVLIVVGYTPVAEAVARLGQLLEYEVVRVVTKEELRDLEGAFKLVSLDGLSAYLESVTPEFCSSMAAVVASQGHYDEPALEPLLRAGVGFVSLLASRKRAATVRELLELQGVPADAVSRIRNPAGLDINAKTPAEVAVSILAEIIQSRPSDAPMFTSSATYNAEHHRAEFAVKTSSQSVPQPEWSAEAQHAPPRGSLRPGYATSPVDGEEIEIATAVHFADYNGVTYYFSCANCKRRFLKDPEKYLHPQPEETLSQTVDS